MKITLKDCFNNDTQGIGIESTFNLPREKGKVSFDDVEIRFKLSLPWNSYDLRYFIYIPRCKYPTEVCYSIMKNYKGMQKKLGILKSKYEDMTKGGVKIGLEPSDMLYVYIENNILDKKYFLENNDLDSIAKDLGITVVLRDDDYRKERGKLMKALAFISHDSRDKELIARPIAQAIHSKLFNVWYDEYSLTIGDNLRESIEKGIKESRKCILILSPNFLNNPGWTKKEFDSIFTKEIIEKDNVILPIWYKVSAEDIYNYSPSLANTVALHWPIKENMNDKDYDIAINRITTQIINQLI